MQSVIKQFFEEQGYVTSAAVLNRQECGQVLTRLKQIRRQPMDWQKGWAPVSAEYYALATNHRILEVVTALLGKDVLLWGVHLLSRPPKYIHHWHTDMESSAPDGETVSVRIGLGSGAERSLMKVVPFSHQFSVTIQQVMQEKGKSREDVTDADVDEWAKERDGRSGMLPLEISDGDALFFDGRLWHGTDYLSQNTTRHAVLLQYATPKTAIRIPNSKHLTWPFEFYEDPKPPCIIVSGQDTHAVNRIVPARGEKRRGINDVENTNPSTAVAARS